ncbi:MAG: hypothetical protein RLZZ232_1770 [Planctomycetota bacterium]
MQLLVSVRNVIEADAALAGGADVIDVKEPASGSLGMAGPETIGAIAERCRRYSALSLCSAALGELPEWSRVTAAPEKFKCLEWAQGLSYLKVGLAGTLSSPDWLDQWLALRSLFPGSVHWVAVAYADASRAMSPTIERIAEVAAQTSCRVLLLDTFQKDASTLFDWVSPDQLCRLRAQCRETGLRLAIAGRLDASHLPVLRTIDPDLLAVRGAVCEAGERTSAVAADRVKALRMALA